MKKKNRKNKTNFSRTVKAGVTQGPGVTMRKKGPGTDLKASETTLKDPPFPQPSPMVGASTGTPCIKISYKVVNLLSQEAIDSKAKIKLKENRRPNNFHFPPHPAPCPKNNLKGGLEKPVNPKQNTSHLVRP